MACLPLSYMLNRSRHRGCAQGFPGWPRKYRLTYRRVLLGVPAVLEFCGDPEPLGGVLIYTYKEIYYKELAHVVMGIGKSRDKQPGKLETQESACFRLSPKGRKILMSQREGIRA